MNLFRCFLLLFLSWLPACGKAEGQKTDPIYIGGHVIEHGSLRTEGNKILDKNGQPHQLRGMSLFWSNWGGKYWNEGIVKSLAQDWKVTVVRAAVGVENDNGYLQNPEYHKRILRDVVREAIAQDIYVIIDWHDHNAHLHQRQALEFFDEFSKEFGQYPHVIFELFNEPIYISWGQIKSYAEPVIDKIRDNGSQNLVIVGTPKWSQDVDAVIGDPIRKENVAYALHFYAATHRQWLRDKGNAALREGLPLFVTEFGLSEASGDGRLDYQEMDSWLSWMNEHSIGYANWSIFDKPESSAALKPGADPFGQWTDKDLTASGSYMKNLLRSPMTSRDYSF